MSLAVRRGARIAYEVVDEAVSDQRPWLVFVQGLAFDRAGWAPITPALAEHFRIVLIDNRGSGDSDPPPALFSVRDMADDVLAVLDDLHIDRAHLVGASLGGMVAQEIAIDNPERVDSLVLLSTTPGWPNGVPMPWSSWGLLAATRQLPPDVAIRRHIENATSSRSRATQPDLVERLVEYQRTRPLDMNSLTALAAAGARYFGGTRYCRITAPTLVVHGSADAVVHPRNSVLLARGIRASRLTILAEAGHLLAWEAPEALLRVVHAFLLPAPSAVV